jgi:hypothetical protein
VKVNGNSEKSRIDVNANPSDSATKCTNDIGKQKPRFSPRQFFHRQSSCENYSLMLHVLIDDVRLRITFELFRKCLR